MNQLHKYFVLIALIAAAGWPLSAQTTSTPVLAAYNDAGRIALQVRDYNNLQTLFAAGEQETLQLEFYFSPDDPRNGFHESEAISAGQGQTERIRFNGLYALEEDDLTFIATRYFQTGPPRQYKFYRGEYRGEETRVQIRFCPARFICHPKGYEIIFNINEFQVLPEHNTIPVTFYFGPGHPNNRVFQIHAVSTANNSFICKVIGETNCEEIMAGTVTVIIGDLSCTYINGFLQSSNCSPFDEYYESDCMELFEACNYELMSLIFQHGKDLPCKQWYDWHKCNTVNQIYRNGNVAIGTNGAAPGAKLTVKNGVITDKVFVEFCTDGGWCDYVFDDDYTKMPLDQLEAYLDQYRHLPKVPSAAAIESEGAFDLGAVTVSQQEKIEEVFLHLIDLENELDLLEVQLFWANLHNRLNPGMRY